jgi:antitoxin component YwqK of YwqJK toxin-antitoxin module
MLVKINIVTKSSWLAFLLLLIIVNLFGQPSADGNVMDKSGKKQGFWTKKYEGKEDVLYKGQFKNDKPYGTFEYFYEGGKTKAIVKHSNDGKSSYSTSFYPNGKTIMAEGKYVLQQKDSTWVFYDTAGKLKTKENYTFGKLNGISTIYYSDGSVSEKNTFVNGVRNGEWLQFYSNGNKRLTSAIKNDISYEGEYTQFFENGKPKISGKYEDGLREGTWFTYLENGAIEAQYLYRLGKIVKEKKENGTFKEYYPDDIPKSEYTYKQGKKNGAFKEFYMLGEWKTKYTTDAEDGSKQEFLALDGVQIKIEGTYLEDQLDGEIIYYLQNGEEEKREKYIKGKLTH